MKIGSYEFKEFKADNVNALPETSGFILMQDRASGLYDFAVSNNIRRRAKAALHGEVTPNIQRLYPVAPESKVKFLYHNLGDVVRPVIYRHRLQVALKDKLLKRNPRGMFSKGYAINIFTYPETSEYCIAIQTMASREDPLVRMHRLLNNKRQQTHQTKNPVIRNFSKKYGPFDANNSFIKEQYQTNIETLKEAKQIAKELALKLGTEYLLTANVVDRSQWKHPGWLKGKDNE